MKKVLTLTIVAILAISALFACGAREKVDISGFTSLSDINGSNAYLAAQTGTFHLTALENQTNGVTVKEYEDFTLLLTALNSGAIDGYVAEEPTAWAMEAKDETLGHIALVNNSTGFTASDDEAGIAIAFQTGSPLVATANAALANLSQDARTNLMQSMVAIAENPDTTANIILPTLPENGTANGTLKIAMECAYAPYNWTQTTDANGAVKIANVDYYYANGYDVQVARYIAASLGMELEVYAMEWDSLIAGVKAGTVTGIIAGMSPTAEREEEVDFTDCYWSSNLVIIYKK